MELLHIDKEGGQPGSPDAPDRTAGPGPPPRERGCGCERPIGSEEEHVLACCDGELETSFVYVDENVNLRLVTPGDGGGGVWKGARAHKPSCNGSVVGVPAPSEALPELSLLSDDDLFSSEGPGTSVDYGFIGAVTFLVTGISLVIVSYAVPRQVPAYDGGEGEGGVSAREMERLEAASARVGAHLDRCVIAGLCLLTLGGVVLSSLLMASLWKGEVYRRRAFACSKRRAALYGSTQLRTRSSPSHCSAHLSLEELEEETAN